MARVSTARWNLKEGAGKTLVRRTGSTYEAAAADGRGVPRLRFKRIVLIVVLRQDESLDSPFLARIGESRFDDAFKSYYPANPARFPPCPQRAILS